MKCASSHEELFLAVRGVTAGLHANDRCIIATIITAHASTGWLLESWNLLGAYAPTQRVHHA